MSPTFDTLRSKGDNRSLIRKASKATAWLADLTVDLPASLFAEDNQLVDLPELGWKPVGLVPADGYEFAREISPDEITSLGYASPTRSDITTVPRSINVTPQQFGQRHINELKYGVNLSGVTQDETTGEVVFDEPELPVGEEYRLLVIASDGAASENWIFAKGYGRVKLTGGGNETWGSEGAVQSQLTLGVFVDDEIGSPVRHYFGGTGALKYKDVLDYSA